MLPLAELSKNDNIHLGNNLLPIFQIISFPLLFPLFAIKVCMLWLESSYLCRSHRECDTTRDRARRKKTERGKERD